MNEPPPPSEEPVTPEPGEVSPVPQASPAPNATPSKLVDQAREDLAGRLNIPVDQITLLSAQGVTWPDSSLGCPQPGMAYTQVLTAGYLILLEAGGKSYEYHANRGTHVFYCENPEPPVPGMPGDV